MLTRLHVQGYKALRDIDTTLEPLTVIVGPNGCGKTSVLESIAMVRDFLVGPEEASRKHPLQELRSKEGDRLSDLRVKLWLRPNQAQELRLRDAFTGPATDPVERQVVCTLRGDQENRADSSVSVEPRGPGERLKLDTKQGIPWGIGCSVLGSTRSLALDINAMAGASYPHEMTPRVGDDGSGLASVLASLTGEQPEKFEELQAQLRELVPEVERIRIRHAPVSIIESQDVPVALDDQGREVVAKRRYQREVVGNEILFDFRHARGVPARHASEGTLLLLGLLTVVITAEASVLLLDDVDRALHPKAQQQLVAYLRKLTERGVQVIATTHSPYLVLHLEYEEVRAMMMSDSGGALIGKLTDHPEYARWREEMTPSEFWTVFGEEWLTRAKAEHHG